MRITAPFAREGARFLVPEKERSSLCPSISPRFSLPLSCAFLGLGSNLGDRLDNLRAAVAALEGIVIIKALSKVYETAPMHLPDQPMFLNMAVRIGTDLAPLALLTALKGIESALGRKRGIRWGPRLIDLDILLYEDVVMNDTGLTIPHPRLAERRFALAPLADVAGCCKVHPQTGQTVGDMIKALAEADPIIVMTETLM